LLFGHDLGEPLLELSASGGMAGKGLEGVFELAPVDVSALSRD
jgi:hypothetical protein